MSAPATPAHEFSRFVALGDSTTEGLMDPGPGAAYRGWADRLAEMLAVASPQLLYANLAIRGRKLPQIRSEQLEAALAMKPDLASVLGGVNDILRPKVDLDQRADDLETIVAELRGAGATVLLFNYPDLTDPIPLAGSRMRGRIATFNRRIAAIADRHGAVLVDLEGDDLSHPTLWSEDRLHASPIGHERIAALAADSLGVAELATSWQRELIDPPSRGALRRAATEARWAGLHLAPWVLRRIRGVSSGDGLPPKRPTLEPVVKAER